MSGRRSLDMDRRIASLVPFEERVFVRYGLRPQTRQVRLSEPELSLRAVACAERIAEFISGHEKSR